MADPLDQFVHNTRVWHDGYDRGQEKGRTEGAAVAFGLMGMAEAIGQKLSLEACPECGRASGSWVTETWHPWRRCCFDCSQGSPDRRSTDGT